MNSGIYQIRNIADNKIYIGSSSNLKRRRYVHFSSLSNGTHYCLHMQRAYNKYGMANFVFEVLAVCPKEKFYLLKLEQFFLNVLKPQYNTLKVAGSQLGTKHSLAAKLKMSLRQLGKKKSSAHLQILMQSRLKPIQQICPLTCNIITEYNSIKEAADNLRIDKGDITKVAKGKRKTVGGFVWRYK